MNPSHPASWLPGRALLIFLTSASALAYEILLMRLFSIAFWHHFAYMVISLALLGFGAAGSLLFLSHEWIKPRLDGCLVALAGLLGFSFSLAFSLSQKVGADPLNLIWQGREWFRVLLVYVLLSTPFLLAGGIVGIILSHAGERTHLLYGLDLLGAGCGVLACVPALYPLPPWDLIPWLGGLVLAGAFGCSRLMVRPVRGLLFLIGAAVLTVGVHVHFPAVPRMHETKALPMTLASPDARIEVQSTGPLGLIHGVGSSLIRHVPGLSLHFGLHAGKGETLLPEQKALFVDGDAPSPVARFSGHLDELEYLDFTTPALPYHTRHPGKVLIIGGGGGSDVLLGLRHRVREMVVLEANRQVVDLMKGPFAAFSGNIYLRPDVRIEVRDARQFLCGARERFDLIQLTLLDSFGSAAGGLHSAAEDYLYTTEAFSLYLNRLTESGVVALTRWLKLPPRDSLRLVATALSALKKAGLSEHPEKHLLFIRSWKTSTVLFSRSPFSREEIAQAARFCDERGFDMAYYAGMEVDRANRYDIQPLPLYYEGAKAIAGAEGETFVRGYAFDISPTTDDRPYFSHFFRWDRAVEFLRRLQREWLPMVELGYLLILVTLGQSLLAGTGLILLPLAGLRRAEPHPLHSAKAGRGRELLATLFYFGCIGAGFMFMEMALLPRYTLLLSHPIYSASVVLGSVLVFAGAGSMCAERLRMKQVMRLAAAVGVLCCWVGFHLLFGDRLMEWALPLPLGCRVGVAVLLLSVLAFFLGWPFPTGLRFLHGHSPRLVPWAWGINGCASVVGAALGKGLAVTFGLKAVLVAACGLYAAAVVVFWIGFTFPASSDIHTH